LGFRDWSAWPAGFNSINASANGLHNCFPMIEAAAQYL